MNKQHAIAVLRKCLIQQEEIRKLLEELEREDELANDTSKVKRPTRAQIEESVDRSLRRRGLIK